METILNLLQEIDSKPNSPNLTAKIPALSEDIEAQRIKNIVLPKLGVIEQEIDNLFFITIKNCTTQQEANIYFDLLQKIQEVLAMLLFKEHVELSHKLRQFVRDCDRLDDSWLRSELTNRIKQGKYNYDFMEKWGSNS